MRDLESIKRDYSIVEIARRLGMEITKDDKAICPFHNDKNPSLSFNTKENYYHCFSCNAGGDNIRLVMEYLKCDFRRAVEFITGESFYNIRNDKRERDSRSYHNTKRDYNTDFCNSVSENKEKSAKENGLNNVDNIIEETPLKNEPVYRENKVNIINNSANSIENAKQNSEIYKYFISILDNSDAILYLEKRKISKEQVINHSIKNIAKDRLIQKEIINNLLKIFSEDCLIKSGIIAKNKENNSLYLMHYKHRLLLPYFDENNNIVAIQGRAIDDKNTMPKYLFNKNSKDTIYNIEKLDSYTKDIVLCEGVIDALSLERLGLNSIAISGASKYSLIEKNEKLKNYNIYIFADEDKAGEILIKKLYNLDNFKGKFLLERFLNDNENNKKIKDINELLNTVEIKTFKIENIIYNYFEMPNDKICILDYDILSKAELKKIDKKNFNYNLKQLIIKKRTNNFDR